MKQNFMGGGDYLQERLLVVISKAIGGGRLCLLVNGRNLVTTCVHRFAFVRPNG